MGGVISVDGLVFSDIATENSGGLKAFGGRIELGGLAASGTIGLNVNGNELRLSFPEGVALADVSLTNNAEVNVRAGGGGDIAINARNLDLSEGSSLLAGIESGNGSSSSRAGDITLNATEGIAVTGIVTAKPEQSTRIRNNVLLRAIGDSGDIIIQTGAIAITDNGRLSASTFGEGNAGSVAVQATGPFSLSNSFVSSGVGSKAIGNGGAINISAGSLSLTNDARLTTTTFGRGNAGNVSVQANDLVSLTGRETRIFSTVEAGAVGNGGNIIIKAGSLSLRDAAQLQTRIQGRLDTIPGGHTIPGGQGNAGNVSIDVRDTVTLSDTVTLAGVNTNDGGLISSAILTDVGSGAIGKGGDINIKTGSLSLMDGAQLITATLGQGNAGDVSVQANDLVSLTGKDTGLFSTVEPGAVGNGGNINIRAGSLSVMDGAQLQTLIRGPVDTIEGSKRAGDIMLNLSDSLTLTGSDSGLFASTDPGSIGNGGNIFIDPNSVTISDGARIAVDSLGQGDAGRIQIQAGSLTLENGAFISAETASGQGGNITLQLQDLLLLRRGSQISTTAGSAQAGGDGGNIDIDTNLLVAVPSENSDITANAFTGSGGRVQITAQGIFGTQFREDETPQSDITASSEFGVDGVVEINTPDIDPSRGLVNAADQPAEAEVAQACQPGGSQDQSEFIVTGRGGLPPNPKQALSSDAIEVDWVTLNPGVENRSSPTVSTNPTAPEPEPIVEAQGWVIGDNGEVVLTATAPTVTAHNPWMNPATCHTPETSS